MKIIKVKKISTIMILLTTLFLAPSLSANTENLLPPLNTSVSSQKVNSLKLGSDGLVSFQLYTQGETIISGTTKAQGVYVEGKSFAQINDGGSGISAGSLVINTLDNDGKMSADYFCDENGENCISIDTLLKLDDIGNCTKNCPTPPPPANTDEMWWSDTRKIKAADIFNTCNNLNAAATYKGDGKSYDDWRVPTVEEVISAMVGQIGSRGSTRPRSELLFGVNKSQVGSRAARRNNKLVTMEYNCALLENGVNTYSSNYTALCVRGSVEKKTFASTKLQDLMTGVSNYYSTDLDPFIASNRRNYTSNNGTQRYYMNDGHTWIGTTSGFSAEKSGSSWGVSLAEDMKGNISSPSNYVIHAYRAYCKSSNPVWINGGSYFRILTS